MKSVGAVTRKNSEKTYNSHHHRKFPAFPPDLKACRAQHLLQCSMVARERVEKQNQVLCTARWPALYSGYRGVWEGLEEEAGCWSIVYGRCNPDGLNDRHPERMMPPWLGNEERRGCDSVVLKLNWSREKFCRCSREHAYRAKIVARLKGQKSSLFNNCRPQKLELQEYCPVMQQVRYSKEYFVMALVNVSCVRRASLIFCYSTVYLSSSRHLPTSPHPYRPEP